MKQKKDPLVTIVTLVYNSGDNITETLNSVKNQSYSNIEHIIIDDCSSDRKTVDIVLQWIRQNDYSCNFIRHDQNKGITATLNEAISIAKGKYISIIGDDVMLPHKISKDIAYLEANPDIAFCYSKMILRFVDMNEEKAGDFYKGSDNLFYDYISGKTTITTPTVTYTREIFNKVGLFDESLLFEDYDMYLRITYKYRAAFLNYYSVIYNINSRSIQYRQQIAIYKEFFNVLEKKWKHLPNYRYYKNNRHQYTFCQLASSNKKEALKHLFPSLTIFWKKRLYSNLFKFAFIWN